MERLAARFKSFQCPFRGCSKVCRSSQGLKQHVNRQHPSLSSDESDNEEKVRTTITTHPVLTGMYLKHRPNQWHAHVILKLCQLIETETHFHHTPTLNLGIPFLRRIHGLLSKIACHLTGLTTMSSNVALLKRRSQRDSISGWLRKSRELRPANAKAYLGHALMNCTTPSTKSKLAVLPSRPYISNIQDPSPPTLQNG
jgi:hypothetical protein